MRSLFLLLALAPVFLLHAANPKVVSAANPGAGVTPNSLATLYGDKLATVTQSAGALPWPTALGDMPFVRITDSAQHDALAPLLYVSPSQINLWIPAGLATGPATLTFPVTGLPPGTGAAALRNVGFTLAPSAPALFALDAGDVAAATAIRVTIPINIQSPVPVFECSKGSNCTAVPIDVGVDAPVYLSLYGTGIPTAGVTVTIAGLAITPTYAGPQGDIPGLAQINVPIPLTLRGKGLVDVSVTAGAITSPPVKLAFQ
jgi:uncharacterized protein (TIGR03437 family)